MDKSIPAKTEESKHACVCFNGFFSVNDILLCVKWTLQCFYLNVNISHPSSTVEDIRGFLEMTSLWGEFETADVSSDEVIPAEIVKLFVMKAMQVDPFRIPIPLPKPIQEECEEEEEVSETQGLEMDDRVIHTIKLMQHSSEMSQLIEAAREQTELMADSQINTFPPALSIPPQPIKNSKCKLNYPIQHLNKDFSDFSLGKGQKIPKVDTKTAKELLKKSVAVLLAHAGYHTTKESILNTFVDVVEEYIKKMTMLLRMAVDKGANVMATGFPDAMERVFHDMNIGSVRCLHKYYQTRIIKYHEKVLEECKSLNCEYNNISIPVKSETLSLDSITKIEQDDVPEIHFPALCEGEGVDELQPSLEQGFQMLHNLEQEVHLQNIEQQEEETPHLNDSPCQEVPVDNLNTQFLPKRRKRM